MKTLHNSRNYAAFLHPRCGLIVQSTRKPGGVSMRPDHSQFLEYISALETAIDSIEADALCRALLNP